MATLAAESKATEGVSTDWNDSQRYELDFWKNHWPYRHLPMSEMQELRHRDATWLLTSLGFQKQGERGFAGFAGSVLEVGCGPIGFFELVEGVRVTANDSLMRAYASEIPYSTLGTRGSSTYVESGVEAITEKFRFVVCSNVLDHTADWLEFLELLASRVDAGGELLLMTDTRDRPASGHTQVFSPAQLRRALRWLGLGTLKHDRVERVTDGHCDSRIFIRAAR